MPQQTVRINKALADAGVCSRRKADELIAAGVITVNGERVVSPGLQISPGIDTVAVNGRQLQQKPLAHCYLILYKPARVLSTASDPKERTTVLDFVPPQWRGRRLYPVGRLDFFSEGLILLTDDGALTNCIIHPRHHIPRRYRVLVRENVTEQMLIAMRTGMTLAEGEKLAPVNVHILPGNRHDLSGQRGRGQVGILLELTLHEGRNRQIRRMCRDLGLTILRLIRVGLGPIQTGSMRPGEIRALTRAEITALRNATGVTGRYRTACSMP